MSCPHGTNSNPRTCSQCQGVIPRVVRVVNSVVTIDDRPLGTLRELNAAQEARIAGNKYIAAGGRAAKAPRTCTICGQSGHNRTRCGQSEPTIPNE